MVFICKVLKSVDKKTDGTYISFFNISCDFHQLFQMTNICTMFECPQYNGNRSKSKSRSATLNPNYRPLIFTNPHLAAGWGLQHVMEGPD